MEVYYNQIKPLATQFQVSKQQNHIWVVLFSQIEKLNSMIVLLFL